MKHLSQSERYQISALRKAGKGVNAIAKAVGRSGSTVSRELRRNSAGDGYDPESAQRRAERRRRTAHVHRTFGGGEWAAVDALLRDDLSPDQASGRLRRLGARAPSAEWIYRHVWDDKLSGGDLHEHLRVKGRRRRPRGRRKDSRGVIPNRRPLADRPAVVEGRGRFGDLEVDTVIGKGHRGAILTVNDRACRLCWARLLRGKNAEELADALIGALLPYKEQGLLHTITSDNGKEFACHERVAAALGVDFYFARPYHSSDRGANENMNGLIRQYFPKGTDFGAITDEDVRKVADILNDRPRRGLDYMTPKEYLLHRFNIVALTS